MVGKRGWTDAAEQLGLEIVETGDFGMPTALAGTVGAFGVEIVHDPGAVEETRARITVELDEPVSDSIFTVGPYRPPGRGVRAFYRPIITPDPPFNVRFTIDADPEHRDGALAFLDGRNRSLLMSLQRVTPQLTFDATHDGASITCWTERRPGGESLVRIVRAAVRVAEAMSSSGGTEPSD